MILVDEVCFFRFRAAQFSPFAALTGYEAAVAEAGRLVDERLELSEERAQFLDSCLYIFRSLTILYQTTVLIAILLQIFVPPN